MMRGITRGLSTPCCACQRGSVAASTGERTSSAPSAPVPVPANEHLDEEPGDPTHILDALLAANFGERPIDPELRRAMQFTQRAVFQVDARNAQAMAWEVEDHDGIVVVDKPGGLNNSSTYIGFVPAQKLGFVILMNRGDQHPHEFGRRFLVALARAHAD